MSLKTDAGIAQSSTMRPIGEIAARLGLNIDGIESYGHYKVEIGPTETFKLPQGQGHLILATAINPTPTSEGRATVTIGLADALCHISKDSVIALREPSLGPVPGVKGGVTGGGHAQVLLMEDINLYFTGDFHAIDAANSLLTTMFDSRIYQGNKLNIDPKRMLWRHVVDMNDRQLRNIIDGVGKPVDGVIRPDGFDITVASEVMAVFYLAKDIDDLKEHLGSILIAYTKDGNPVYAKNLKTHGTMAALLKDAIEPSLVQTIEGTPVLVHGGPFTDIAHSCNSVTATRLAKHLADYAVTEAGFDVDLGTEKFCDIRCRLADLKPDTTVIVATVRALKYNNGAEHANLGEEGLEVLAKGLPNLLKHISNLKNVLSLPVIVAINHFVSDSDVELAMIEKAYAEHDVEISLTEVWGKGGMGDAGLARKVVSAIDNQLNNFSFAYGVGLSIKNKIHAVTQKVYGMEDIDFSAEVSAETASLERLDLDKMPVYMAGIQYSFSNGAELLGYPEGFRTTVCDIIVFAGAGLIVIPCGNMMKIPDLPKVPAAEKIDVDADGVIHGLL